MSLFPSFLKPTKLFLSFHLLSTLAGTMEKEESIQAVLNSEKHELKKISSPLKGRSKDENLNNLAAIRKVVDCDLKELKSQLESEETVSPSQKVRQELKLYKKAAEIIDNARKVYISYNCFIVQAAEQEKSTLGFAFLRYVKLLAYSNELNLLTKKTNPTLLRSRIKLFKNAIYLIKQSLPPEEMYWTDFLNIKESNDIRLSVVQIVHTQAKECKNIYNIISKIDLEKFSFNNADYKKVLSHTLAQMKEDAAWGINQKTLKPTYLQDSKINLVHSNGFSLNLVPLRNKKMIENTYRILFNLFDIRFHHGNIIDSKFYDHYPLEECVFLSDKEKTENYPIFYEMIAGQPLRPREEAVPTIKSTRKKNKSAAQRQRKKELTRQRKVNTPVKKQEELAQSSSIEEPTQCPLQLSQSETILPTSGDASPTLPIENKTILDKADPRQECKEWLQQILNRASSKQKEYFSIFHKGRSLLKELEVNAEWILFDIQQATSNLAARLQDVEQHRSLPKKKSDQIIVPKNYEYSYLYFMETPITYLHNNLRFGVIKRLINGLGGEIDNSRSGSRISLTLNKVTTSIHLHDSNNGILEGGRISALRKFFIEAGTVLQEDIRKNEIYNLSKG
jgi:hypothetical protein